MAVHALSKFKNIKSVDLTEQGCRLTLFILGLFIRPCIPLISATKYREYSQKAFYIGSVQTALYPPHQRNERQGIFSKVLYIRGIICILRPQCGIAQREKGYKEFRSHLYAFYLHATFALYKENPANLK